MPIAAGERAGTAEARHLPGFEEVARLVASALQVPLVALLLSDGSAFWHHTAEPAGLNHFDAPLLAACRARLGDPGAEVVADARHDPRFRVEGAEIGFFAREPVFASDGHHLGALFLIDRRVHAELEAAEREALRDGARLASTGAALRHYLSRTNPATQLPHRMAFLADLAHLLQDAGNAWLLVVDVCPVGRFHALVRAMGNPYADELIRQTASRIASWLPAGHLVYHVAPTRLAAVFPAPDEPPSGPRLDTLVTILRTPIDCLGVPLSLQPGVGVLPVHAEELRGGDPLRRAMSASFLALNQVRGWAVYDREQDERERQEFFLVTELAAALNEGSELELYFQPRVEVASQRCTGFEALARWRHPTLGPVSPAVFVPLAEQAGLMRSLTAWVFEEGIRQLAAWHAAGLVLKLSLNLSAADVDPSLPRRLAAIAERHGVALEHLELELTEGTALRHTGATGETLAALRAAGIGIAIDDYGVGYSNLDALRRMPATTLKIDQSLIRGMEPGSHDLAIVASMIALGHELGFAVVLEGVETDGVLAAVAGLGADELQGFHISLPMPAAAVPDWLRDWAARHAPPAA